MLKCQQGCVLVSSTKCVGGGPEEPLDPSMPHVEVCRQVARNAALVAYGRVSQGLVPPTAPLTLHALAVISDACLELIAFHHPALTGATAAAIRESNTRGAAHLKRLVHSITCGIIISSNSSEIRRWPGTGAVTTHHKVAQ